jgi:uncharacterized protein
MGWAGGSGSANDDIKGGQVNSELEALLALQSDDERIWDLDSQLQALAPRLKALDRARKGHVDALARAQQSLEAEERREHELQHKVAEYKQLLERNQGQLDAVRKTKEATAAMIQLDMARRMLGDAENELQSTVRRVVDARAAAKTQQELLDELDLTQQEERERVAGERAKIEAELAEAKAVRDAKVHTVARPLLAKYDRIRGRRGATAVFALRDASCGHCDTAIPLQRRNIMFNTGSIEVCEACGVLLYAVK